MRTLVIIGVLCFLVGMQAGSSIEAIRVHHGQLMDQSALRDSVKELKKYVQSSIRFHFALSESRDSLKIAMTLVEDLLAQKNMTGKQRAELWFEYYRRVDRLRTLVEKHSQ